MDHRPDDALNDATIEREVESMLAVDPSPAFVARVRTRVASEVMGQRWRPFPRAWSFEPLFAVGILGVVMLFVALLWLRPEPPTAVAEQPAASTPPAPQQVATEPSRRPASAESSGGARRNALRARARQPDQERLALSDASPFAEVLLSENDQRALALLLTPGEQGRLPPPPAVSGSGQMESADRPAIEIPDLVIEPLPQIAQLAIGERP
jgi:hypothetical protein